MLFIPIMYSTQKNYFKSVVFLCSKINIKYKAINITAPNDTQHKKESLEQVGLIRSPLGRQIKNKNLFI